MERLSNQEWLELVQKNQEAIEKKAEECHHLALSYNSNTTVSCRYSVVLEEDGSLRIDLNGQNSCAMDVWEGRSRQLYSKQMENIMWIIDWSNIRYDCESEQWIDTDSNEPLTDEELQKLKDEMIEELWHDESFSLIEDLIADLEDEVEEENGW